jgi:N-acetylmuramoyl-L-alanine amidase
MKICINAGHYPGLDSGAVGFTGLQESIVVRDIAHKVCNYLTAVGYETLFVQENELYQITDASNEFGADLFVSLHCNAAENTDAKGTETFFANGSINGVRLAQCIQDQIVNNLHTVDRGIKTDNFYVLRHTDCTAVLVENAFISNHKEEIMLADINKRDELAKAISRGITDYVGGEK